MPEPDNSIQVERERRRELCWAAFDLILSVDPTQNRFLPYAAEALRPLVEEMERFHALTPYLFKKKVSGQFNLEALLALTNLVLTRHDYAFAARCIIEELEALR